MNYMPTIAEMCPTTCSQV